MKTEAEVAAKLAEVEKDFTEYGRVPAEMFINAPRALMQTEKAAIERTLAWVLGIEPKGYEDKKKGRG